MIFQKFVVVYSWVFYLHQHLHIHSSKSAGAVQCTQWGMIQTFSLFNIPIHTTLKPSTVIYNFMGIPSPILASIKINNYCQWIDRMKKTSPSQERALKFISHLWWNGRVLPMVQTQTKASMGAKNHFKALTPKYITHSRIGGNHPKFKYSENLNDIIFEASLKM